MPDVNEYVAECPICGTHYNKQLCNNRCPKCGHKEAKYTISTFLSIIMFLTVVGIGFYLMLTNGVKFPKIFENNERITIKYDLYYSQLNDNEKKIYGKLEANIGNLPNTINIPSASNLEIERAVEAFKYANPQCFWLDNVLYGYSSIGFVRQYYIQINYDPFINTIIKNVSDATNAIISEVVDGNDIDKIKYVHDWIINNTEYNIEITEEGQDITSVLLNHESVCSGYANAFAYLMQKLGYECYVITGSAATNDGIGSHAWNLLKLNGSWYWVDVTWDETKDIYGNEYEPRYDYFLKSDSDLIIDHYPDSRFMYPSCY